MFFLQMSGYPGSGKSTLARAISKRTGAVIVDHDIVKSAFLQAMDTALDSKAAGKIAYDVDWALVDYHLSCGHSVILDSPCLYTELLESGTGLAHKHQVAYKYVECFLSDQNVRDERLKNRERMPSQVAGVPAAVRDTFLTVETSKMRRPADFPYLIVDTSVPLDLYLEQTLHYLTQ